MVKNINIQSQCIQDSHFKYDNTIHRYRVLTPVRFLASGESLLCGFNERNSPCLDRWDGELELLTNDFLQEFLNLQHVHVIYTIVLHLTHVHKQFLCNDPYTTHSNVPLTHWTNEGHASSRLTPTIGSLNSIVDKS